MEAFKQKFTHYFRKTFFSNKEKDRKHGRGWGTEGLEKGICKGRRERNGVVTEALLDKGILL